MSEARLRIGELSRRVGVSPELLRAWEARYALLRPERSAGGLRLFSADDERRVRMMKEGIAAGLSASESARVARLSDPPTRAEEVEIRASLDRAFDSLDEPAAQAALDRLFRDSKLPTALAETIIPLLHLLGERWASSETSIAHEHFASNVIGGRLRALARDWGEGVGPRAVLACPPGERHELGLLCFGLTLREQGWRVTYFGAETPLGDIGRVLEELTPAVVVLAAAFSTPLLDASDEIRELSRQVRVGIGGHGATAELAAHLGVELLDGDAVGAAVRLAP